MKKNSEGKIEAVSIDIHGRIEALDQSLRSVDYRLRAVEKRLSVKTPEPEPEQIVIDEVNYLNPNGLWASRCIDPLLRSP